MLLGLSVITVLVIIPFLLALVTSYISMLADLDHDLRYRGKLISECLITKLFNTYIVVGFIMICHDPDHMIINSLCVDVMLTPFMLMVYI